MQLFNLRKTVDWNKPESVDAYLVEVEKINKTEAPANGGAPVQKTANELEVERLRKELADAEKRSNQPSNNTNGGGNGDGGGSRHGSDQRRPYPGAASGQSPPRPSTSKTGAVKPPNQRRVYRH
jgi:hypothetical protein